MDYYKYELKCDRETIELLLAFLGEMPFDSFEEKDNGLDAYLDSSLDQSEIETQLQGLQQQLTFSFEKSLLENKNWNTLWESNFQSIRVGGFCGIRADFHPPFKEVEHEIIINPRMAFGTGHHETTFMVIEAMQELDFKGKKVLDYGCGTGILAILAAKLGAVVIDAVDIETASYENTLDNCRINASPFIQVKHGTLKDIEEEDYQIILANINRNVILATIGTLYNKLLKNGKLIVSGFIEKDELLLRETAQKHGFRLIYTKRKNNWICLVFKKLF